MKGDCDLLLAFEKLEALRMAEFVKEEGRLIVNDQRINPSTVISGAAVYPENIEGILRTRFRSVTFIEALKIAEAVGNPRTANVALLGAASGLLNIPTEIWKDAILSNVPERAAEANLESFQMGSQTVQIR
jgi:indolepyruvate ferredoxin oxidoreductase beta subunit